MDQRRRTFSRQLAAGAAALAAPGFLRAANDKTLKVVVGYAAGGAADNVARAVGEGLRAAGYTVIVENKAGAGGRVAAESLQGLPADGNTLLLAPLSNLTICPHIYRALRYDPLKDFVSVASASGMSFGIAVGSNGPVQSLQQFLAIAKKDPVQGSYGTPGAGTPMHFLGVMLARQSKVPLTHVPYKGGSAALTDAIGGSLPAVITTLPNLLPMHRSAKLRILAISNAEPLASVPGVPTFKSLGYPALTMSERFAFFARSGTPPAIVTALNSAIGAAVTAPVVTGMLQKVEFEPLVMTPQALDKVLRADYGRWAEIVKSTGYTPEE